MNTDKKESSEREPVYRWVKAGDRLPTDTETKAARLKSPGRTYEYSELTLEDDKLFIGEETVYQIGHVHSLFYGSWEWLEQIPAPIPQPVSKETETFCCPNCGKEWDTKINNACQCGALLVIPGKDSTGFAPLPSIAPPIPESLPTEVQCPNCLGEGTEVLSEFGPETCRCCGGLKSVAMDTWEYWTKEYGGNLIPTPVRSINAPTEVPLEILQWISDFQYLSPSPRFNNNEDAWFAGMEEMGQAMYHKLIEDWFSKGPEGYSMCLAAMQKGIYSRDKQIKELQASLSSMKAELSKVRTKCCTDEQIAERYFPAQCPGCGFKGSSSEWHGGGAIADTGDYSDPVCPVCGHLDMDEIENEEYSDMSILLLKHLEEARGKADGMYWDLDAAKREADYARTESESHKKAWEEATAVLGERSVENRELEEEAKDYRDILKIVWKARDNTFLLDAVKNAKKVLNKYPKKEEENK